MFPSIPLLSALFIASSLAIPVAEHSKPTPPFKSTSGFQNPTYSTSAGGYAICLSGLISVPVTATNENLLFKEPANQYAATGTIFDFLKANSSLSSTIAGGPSNISQTFKIAGKLCYPKTWTSSSDINGKTIQFLTHGIGFNQSYWDFTKGYSFIDVAAQQGYPTFSFDRLGTGASSHPDPINVVQASVQVEIIHVLTSLLRSGSLASQTFTNIIGIGHSFGSIQSAGVAARYSKDFDALVLTGFSINTTAIALTFATFDPVIAKNYDGGDFGGLGNGYLVVGNGEGNQLAFFHYPDFDTKIFETANAHRQTFTYGELFTLGSVVAPAPLFTGPVFTVLGEFDFIFAQGNALYPSDQAAQVQPALFPNAANGSSGWVVPGAGHGLNLHTQAGEIFGRIEEFVKGNGF